MERLFLYEVPELGVPAGVVGGKCADFDTGAEFFAGDGQPGAGVTVDCFRIGGADCQLFAGLLLADDRFAVGQHGAEKDLVVQLKIVGGYIGFVGGRNPVVFPVGDDPVEGAVFLYLTADFVLHFVGGVQYVEFVPQNTVDCHFVFQIQLVHVAVGVGYMAAHDGSRVGQHGGILDQHAGAGVGVVAGPDLGADSHHGQVIPSAAAGAVFDHGIRVGFHKPAEQGIYPLHIAVFHGTLVFGSQIRGAGLGDVAVHVPLEVVDGHITEGFGKHFLQVFDHGRVGHVQHILGTGVGHGSARTADAPVGMGAEQVGVGVHHFRFYPDAELHAGFLDPVHVGRKTFLEAVAVDSPVSQPRLVVDPGAEPAVVHDDHIHSAVGSSGGKVHHHVFIDVEEERFPGIQHHGTPFFRFCGNDVVVGEVVEVPGHDAQPLGGVGHNGFGTEHGFAVFQAVVEVFVPQTHLDPGFAGLIPFHFVQEAAAVDKVEAVDIAVGFVSLPVADGHEGVHLVAGSAPAAVHGKIAPEYGGTFVVDPFEAVGTRQRNHVILISGQIQRKAHPFFDDYISAAAVGDGSVPGDHVAVVENGVVQVQFAAGRRVTEGDVQGLCAFICTAAGNGGNVHPSAADLVGNIGEIGDGVACPVLDPQSRGAEIAAAEIRVFQRLGVHGKMHFSFGGIRREGPYSAGIIGVGLHIRPQFFAVVTVDQSALHNVKGVKGIFGGKPEKAVFFLEGNGHIGSPLFGFAYFAGSIVP